MKLTTVTVVAAVAAAHFLAPARARADGGATTVVVAATTAGLTALATYFVKEYFDGRKDAKELERKTEDTLEEVKRADTRAAALEAENEKLAARIAGAESAAAFWTRLLAEDEDFFKPGLVVERVVDYERGLERLFVKDPALVERVHAAISTPAGDWERGIVIRAYGGGVPGADFWELKKRLEQGLEGGIAVPVGERYPRYVSGAENLMAILDFARANAGPDGYHGVLERLWGCTPEEVDEMLAEFPEK